MYIYICTVQHRYRILRSVRWWTLAGVRSQSSSPATINRRRVAWGGPGAGCGVRVGMAPCAIFLSAARFYSRNLRRTGGQRIILYIIIYTHSWQRPCLYWRRAGAGVCLQIIIIIVAVVYFCVRRRRLVGKDKTSAFSSGHDRRRRLIDDLAATRRPPPINHPSRPTRVGSVRADGFGVWSSVGVFPTRIPVTVDAIFRKVTM